MFKTVKYERNLCFLTAHPLTSQDNGKLAKNGRKLFPL